MNTQINGNYQGVPMGQNNPQWPNPPAGAMPYGTPPQGNVPPQGPPMPPRGDEPDGRKRRRTIGWIIAVAVLDLLLLLLYLLLPSRCSCDRDNGGTSSYVSESDDSYFDSIPDDPDAPADSVASDVENVIEQGGQLQFTVSWARNDTVDIDAHCIEPSGYEIFYLTKDTTSPSGGKLDIDNKEHDSGRIEHITYADCSSMRDGTYVFSAVNYTGGNNAGVKAYLTVGDKTYLYQITGLRGQEQRANVAKVTIAGGQVTNIDHLLDCDEVDMHP